MEYSKQVCVLIRIASKLGWEVTGEANFVELMWYIKEIDMYDSVAFCINENKNEILKTIKDTIVSSNNAYFKEHLLELYVTVEKIVRNKYKEVKREIVQEYEFPFY